MDVEKLIGIIGVLCALVGVPSLVYTALLVRRQLSSSAYQQLMLQLGQTEEFSDAVASTVSEDTRIAAIRQRVLDLAAQKAREVAIDQITLHINQHQPVQMPVFNAEVRALQSRMERMEHTMESMASQIVQQVGSHLAGQVDRLVSEIRNQR